jgi:hypothetical protein
MARFPPGLAQRSRFMPCLIASGGNGRLSAIMVAHRKTESMLCVEITTTIEENSEI